MLGKARGNPNRKKNETHETVLARARRSAPPRHARWADLENVYPEAKVPKMGKGAFFAALSWSSGEEGEGKGRKLCLDHMGRKEAGGVRLHLSRHDDNDGRTH